MSTTSSIRCPSCGENVPTDYIVCPYDGYSLIKELREKVRTKIKLREGISRSIRLVKDPLKNTEIVMEEVVTNFDRKGPIFILFMLGWVFGFQIAPYFNAYYSSIGAPQDIVYIFLLGLIGGFIVSLAALFFLIIFWYLLSLVVHFSSKMLTSSIAGASFKETQSIVGYALVPYIVGMFILNILLFFIVPAANPAFFKPEGAVTIFSDEIASSVSLFYLIFFLGFSVWTTYILSNGLEKLHRLSRNQSFAVPIGTLVLYMIIAQMIVI